MSTDRTIRTTVNAVYYDTTFIDNSIQNNIAHYLEIDKIKYYKSLNLILDDSLTVEGCHFLYFSSQRVVSLVLTTDSSLTLKTKEFLLYQPNTIFSFTITNSVVNDKDTCSCNINCMYATRNTTED